MSATITAQELKQKIDSGTKDFVLVDTLKPASYSARHIPSAINIPADPDFIDQFEAKVKVPKETEIITYCSSATCGAHIRAAEALERADYTNVVRYSDGLAGWQTAGFAFESAN